MVCNNHGVTDAGDHSIAAVICDVVAVGLKRGKQRGDREMGRRLGWERVWWRGAKLFATMGKRREQRNHWDFEMNKGKLKRASHHPQAIHGARKEVKGEAQREQFRRRKMRKEQPRGWNHSRLLQIGRCQSSGGGCGLGLKEQEREKTDVPEEGDGEKQD